MNLRDKKVLLVSYHAYSKGSYRPSIMHRYFSDRAARGEIGAYKFMCSDWDHMNKSRNDFSADKSIEALRVPAYTKNISLSRIWSHLHFSLQLFFRREPCQADLVVVCVPPSLSALPLLMYSRFRSKPCVLDLVDLWPEALPASPEKKRLLMLSFGWAWVRLRNLLYGQATLLLSHCRFFLRQLGRADCPRCLYLPLSQQDATLLTEPSNRGRIEHEIRVLVLGSINHVLDGDSLVRLLRALSEKSTGRQLVLEIIGAGESKARLLEAVAEEAPNVIVYDHGMVFEPKKKAEILMRSHFGYNGYRSTSAIGITYKSIDFASAGLAFLNSVQGDLNDMVATYGAGLNYTLQKEEALADRILALSDEDFAKQSEASRRMAREHFHPDRFETDFSRALAALPEPTK